MPDNRNKEIDGTPTKYTAEQDFGDATVIDPSGAEVTSFGGSDESTESQSLNVPGDYATIQQAVSDAVSLLQDHSVTINVEPGTYDEDVIIGSVIGSGVPSGEETPANHFRVIGDGGDTPTVNVESITVLGTLGVGVPHIEQINITGPGPDWLDDTTFGQYTVGVYGCNSVDIDQFTFDSTVENGVEMYSSGGKVHNCNFDGLQHACQLKRNSWVQFADNSGDVTGDAIITTSGYAEVYDNNTVTSNSSSGFGTVYNNGNGKIVQLGDPGWMWLPAARFLMSGDAAEFADPLQANNTVQDGDGGTMLTEVTTSGSTSLSSGSATVNTGVSSDTTATFFVALGPDTDDSEVAVSIEAVSGGNYTVHFDEINSAVGNTTIEYDVIRVR